MYVCFVFGVSTDGGGSGARISWRPRGLWGAQRPRGTMHVRGGGVCIYVGAAPSLVARWHA